MKRHHTPLIRMLILASIISVVSCEKTGNGPANISPNNLTECETCDFLYRENARLNVRAVEEGENKVFMYKEYWTDDPTNKKGASYSGLFFEVAKTDDDAFELGKQEMHDGKVAYIVMCPSCNVIPLKPVDGSIKGKYAGDNKWLVEAIVVLAQETSSDVSDTLTFKQYFMLDR